MSHQSVQLSFVIPLLNALTLVVLVLTLAQRNIQLRKAIVIDIQPQRNNTLSRLFRLAL